MRTISEIEQRMTTLLESVEGRAYDEELCAWLTDTERELRRSELKWVLEGSNNPSKPLDLSNKDVMLLIAGLLCRVSHGYTTGEDHAELLQNLKNRVGITW